MHVLFSPFLFPCMLADFVMPALSFQHMVTCAFLTKTCTAFHMELTVTVMIMTIMTMTTLSCPGHCNLGLLETLVMPFAGSKCCTLLAHWWMEYVALSASPVFAAAPVAVEPQAPPGIRHCIYFLNIFNLYIMYLFPSEIMACDPYLLLNITSKVKDSFPSLRRIWYIVSWLVT